MLLVRFLHVCAFCMALYDDRAVTASTSAGVHFTTPPVPCVSVWSEYVCVCVCVCVLRDSIRQSCHGTHWCYRVSLWHHLKSGQTNPGGAGSWARQPILLDGNELLRTILHPTTLTTLTNLGGAGARRCRRNASNLGLREHSTQWGDAGAAAGGSRRDA